MTNNNDETPPFRYSEPWWHAMAKHLEAHAADDRRQAGFGIDEETLARYVAGTGTEAERERVEQAMQASPDLRECVDIAREFIAEQDTSPPEGPHLHPHPDSGQIDVPTAPAASPASHAKSRLVYLIGYGVAATLIIGVGFLLHRQAAIGRQLAYTQAELAQARQINQLQVDRLNRMAAHRRLMDRRGLPSIQNTSTEFLPLNDIIRDSIDFTLSQSLMLTGVSPGVESPNPQEGRPDTNFIAWLYRQPEGKFTGSVMLFGDGAAAPVPHYLEGNTAESGEIYLKLFMKTAVAWPDPSRPATDIADQQPVAGSLYINVEARTFSCVINEHEYSGKITY